ncbi:MAG: ParB/RepB/Spo0J family partition protein [Candidatus Bathyarchaeia archaeon]|jgi:hypothetical protein
MSSEDDFNLKESKFIGELYPVLKDARGNIIDGNHRLQADPNWEARIVPNVINDETLIIARLVANWQRRQVTPQEKAEWINGLAEIYQQEGYKTLISGNEIVKKIVEVTGLSQPTVNVYLDDKYKVFTDKDRIRKPEISAHERIRRKFGDEFAKRNEQEVKGQLVDGTLTKILNKVPDTEEQLYFVSPVPLAEIPKITAQRNVESICNPLENFVNLDVNILTSLDSEQKEKVLDVLLKSRAKIDEMVKAIQDNR